jgi:hypothetical protein
MMASKTRALYFATEIYSYLAPIANVIFAGMLQKFR